MTIEKRLENLENLVNSLSKTLTRNEFYTDADINGVRQSVSEATPITLTKTAYLDDTEVVFTDVPAGNMTVYFDKPYTVERDNDIVRITFEPLEEVATVTISIL